MPCKHTNHWIIVMCVQSRHWCWSVWSAWYRALVEKAAEIFNWPTMPLLIETTPPTDIGHAPLQLPASWLWYLIQYPHLLLVHSTGSLSIMLHQLFDDTFCSTRLGPQSSQCNSFQYVHHMRSHIWLEFFFIFRGFFIKLIFIYLCHYKRVKNWILISRKF